MIDDDREVVARTAAPIDPADYQYGSIYQCSLLNISSLVKHLEHIYTLNNLNNETAINGDEGRDMISVYFAGYLILTGLGLDLR